MKKLKLGIYPYFFQQPNFIFALEESKFEKFLLIEEGRDDFNGWEGQFNAQPLTLEAKVDLDIIFAQIGEEQELVLLLENYPSAIKIGFQVNYLQLTFLPLRDVFQKFDIILSWLEQYQIIAEFLGKRLWNFPPIFKEIPRIENFDLNRKNLGGIHGVHYYDPPYFSELTFLLLSTFTFGEFHFTPGNLARKRAFDELGLDTNCFKPHKVLDSNEYLKLIRRKCRLMFQYSLAPSYGSGILDAVAIGIPCIASPALWYQQILYPGLVANNLMQAKELLNQDYLFFQPHVEKAQDIYRSYNIQNQKCIREYNKYILNLMKDR